MTILFLFKYPVSGSMKEHQIGLGWLKGCDQKDEQVLGITI